MPNYQDTPSNTSNTVPEDDSRTKAEEALRSMREKAKKEFPDGLSLEEINEIIREVRYEKGGHRAAVHTIQHTKEPPGPVLGPGGFSMTKPPAALDPLGALSQL